MTIKYCCKGIFYGSNGMCIMKPIKFHVINADISRQVYKCLKAFPGVIYFFFSNLFWVMPPVCLKKLNEN